MCMDAKTVVGKTLFFVLICLFVSVFTTEFGQDNHMTGVIVIVLALMLLGRDLSVRPLYSLAILLMSMAAMGLFSFIAVNSGNPYLAALLNFTFVFAICFVNLRDMLSPMHFPFLLGYAYMLTESVDTDGLPMRMAALMTGAVIIVGLNYVFNHRNRKGERAGIVKLCEEVVACCEAAKAGVDAGSERLERLCTDVNRRLYNHMEDRFYTAPNDRALLDLVVSLQVLGAAVCERERDPAVLDRVMEVVKAVSENQGGKTDTDGVLSAIDGFLRDCPSADAEIISAFKTMRDELWRLDYRTTGYHPDVPVMSRPSILRAVLKESFRLDSVRFTFSFRMALIFTICAFIWQYTGEDDAKALMFTVIAMVQPFVEGVARRTAMRLVGTFVGVVLTIMVLMVAGGDLMIVTVSLLVANYLFTLINPKRFDVMMIFVTFSTLLAASMTTPAEVFLTDRVAFVLLGVLISYAANYIIMPYRMRDENIQLAERYMEISGEQINNLRRVAEGERDPVGDAALVLTAATVSAKLSMNLGSRGDFVVERFLSRQDSLTARCRLLSRSMPLVGSECRRRVVSLLASGSSEGTDAMAEGLEPAEADVIAEVASVIESYRKDAMILARIRSTS